MANNQEPVTLAELRIDIRHGFKNMAERLARLETGQAELDTKLDQQAKRIELNEKTIAVLQATTIRWDAIKATVAVSAAVTVIVIVLAVVVKVAGIL